MVVANVIRQEPKDPKQHKGLQVDQSNDTQGNLAVPEKIHAEATLKKLTVSPPPAMRYPAFRAFWFGMVASVSGFQILRFGRFWLIFEIAGSPLALGYVGLPNGALAILLNLLGGVAADQVDQRRLIMVAHATIAVLIFGLATLSCWT